MKAQIIDKKGKNKKTIEVSDNVFGLSENDALVHQVVTSIASNERAGTAHTKFRGEKRGGGRKPWKQKGTGRARHGSRRSPLWVGGGRTFGPRTEKSYSKTINRKMKDKALRTILSQKLRDGKVVFIENLSYESGKTKDAKEFISNLKDMKTILIVSPQKDDNVIRSFNNLKNVSVSELSNLDAKKAMTAGTIIFAYPEETLKVLNKEEK